MIYDLHTHSTASDGILNPTDLVERAAKNNVDFLALTDHDTTKGLNEATAKSKDCDLTLIPGIELSVKWQFYEVHVVGLNIDPENEKLKNGLVRQQQARTERLMDKITRMKGSGISGADGIIESFKSGDHVGRPTVAKFLVENNYCDTFNQAYSRLNRGGDLHVEPNWELMQYAVKWITDAGGVAVLAHPGSYGLDKPGFGGILRDFQNYGGQAVEICYGPCSNANISRWSYYAKKFSLHGSVGSDFHRPARGIELGRVKKLPNGIPGVWELF
ncbi:MAG: PHP domain-containing protein [Lentisphaeraceae bacterium]|nr:PHP domain-containing protein [Lentisphaeraceae bacterium]